MRAEKITPFPKHDSELATRAIAYRKAGASPLRGGVREIRVAMRIAMWKGGIAAAETLKRVLDIVGSTAALIVLAPVFAVTAFLVKREDGGPVFFAQERIGRKGRPFKMWKFRSMIVSAEKHRSELETQNQHEAGVTFKMKADPRITRVGKWIRKYSVDELPQFYNVLCGDMALVGPRPPIPAEVAEYSSFQLRRLRVKPGITCLWQIGGRSEIDFDGQVRLRSRVHSLGIHLDGYLNPLSHPSRGIPRERGLLIFDTPSITDEDTQAFRSRLVSTRVRTWHAHALLAMEGRRPASYRSLAGSCQGSGIPAGSVSRGKQHRITR